MARAALLLLVFASVLPAQKRQVTLDALSAQGRRGIPAVVWGPDGERFAYSEQNRIWIYDITAGRRRELLTFSTLEVKAVKTTAPDVFDWQNRRVAEQNFQWSADGSRMLVAAGGDLFLVDTKSGDIDQLTRTADAERDPKLSPDAARVSFRREHDLYTLDVASKRTVRLTRDGTATLLNGELDWVYPEELDLSTAHWWSPDGKRVAFLQFDVSREPVFPHADLLPTPARFEPQRFPQPGMPNALVRLGVVPRDGGAIRWMDLGDMREALLARVYWSPDSRSLAAIKLNRVQNRLDLYLGDAASGSTRVILHEQDPFWVNVNDFFRFLKDGRFLWGSERHGYRHLYLCASDGRCSQITRGDWEVTDVAAVDESAREVFYVSSEDSPLERQFYRIRFDGSGKHRLSKQQGTHAISMPRTARYYLDTFSSLTSPPERELHSSDGSKLRIYHRAEPEQYEILPTEIVEVKASDGAVMYGKLIRPSGFTPGRKYPVIVMIYGGPHAQSVRNVWSGVTWDQLLAQRGFVIWQLDNRGSAGRGHAWESKVFRNLGEQELQDQRDGIRHLASMGFADTSRMGIYGWSYGGYMTLYALTNAPDLFQAGIAGAPVTHWRNYDSIYTERYMGLPAENFEGYRRSSPLTRAADLKAKLLLVHNLEDDNVHFQNTVQMVDALENAGKLFQMIVYPQKSHGVTGTVRRQLNETITKFFEENLK